MIERCEWCNGRRIGVTDDLDFDELARLRAEAESLTDVLRRNGFVQCDSQACNCGSWHARYGLRQRHDEIIEALAEAGHPLSNDNGYLTLNALQELVDEAARLRAENERLTGALQEIADTPATPDNHDLVAVIMLAQLALRDENGG